MRKVVIDFTDMKTLGQLHLEMKGKLSFPDFYGENLDALWDCLTGFIGGKNIINVSFLGFHTLDEDILEYAMRILETFTEAEEGYGDIRVLGFE